MPARDFYHECAKRALIREGWTITHDPYVLTEGLGRVFVDLAAEQPIGAEREGDKIAVESKCFRGESELHDFEPAVGQYVFDRSIPEIKEPERRTFMAVPVDASENTFQERMTQPVLRQLAMPLIVFRPSEEHIIQWVT